MPKRAIQVILTEREQEELMQITKRHRSEQQQVLRAHIVLAAAQGYSNVQIAHELAINVDTARLWRDRWGELQGIDRETLAIAERLQDAPRPGAPARITIEQRCQIAALACEAPMKAGRPISQWTGREIADELKKRGIIEQISPRHASYLREIWGLQPHRFRYWLTEVADSQREEKIIGGCQLYARAAERAKQGERTISMDELTGVQAKDAQTS
jgi:transposase